MPTKTKQDAFDVIEFAHTITPLPTESDVNSGKWIHWGGNNLYPNFLLKMFEEVPLHQSICVSKVDYLLGDGLVVKGTGAAYDAQVNPIDTAEELAFKLAFDYVLSGMFVVEVQYNYKGEPIYLSHIPFNWVRCNKLRTKFWVCQDWQATRKILDYNKYTPGRNPDLKSRIFMYRGYVPSANSVYPSIRYKSAITSMVTEILVNDFNKDSLEEGFSAATLISFFKGLPQSKAAQEFEKKFAKTMTGTRGKKYMIDWNNPTTSGMESTGTKVDSIPTPDYSSKLEGVNKKTETNILTAHQATSRILFGVEQAGGLGNGTELEAAYQIFFGVWVKSNRNILERGINSIFKACGFPEVEFKDKGSILKKSLSDATKEKVYTKNELRNVDGLEARSDGDAYIEIKAPVAAPNGFAKQTPFSKKLTEEDFDKVKDLGQARGAFAVLDEAEIELTSQEAFRAVELAFDDASDIENYLLENDISGKTLSEIKADIRKALGIVATASELDSKIKRMIEAGILDDSKIAKEKPLTRDVQVMYQYEVRPGYGDPLIQTSRGFCVKLINNDRYYSRQDIQQMSAIFGYDVFKHCGGWYFNAEKNEAEPQCRHYFKSVRVIKKSE